MGNEKENDLVLTEYSNSRLTVGGLGLIEDISVSFDRITVVGNIIESRKNYLKSFLEKDPRVDLKDTGFDRFKCYGLNNKFYAEYDKKKSQFYNRNEIRIEFNPNKLSEEEINFIKCVFLDSMRNKDFSRIDLAFDIRGSLEDYLVISNKGIKKSVFYGRNDKPETKYFGVRDSERYIRIYNKKKQLNDVERKEVNEKSLWRVEFELKRSMTEKWDKCFDDLSIIKPEYLVMDDFSEQAKIFYLINDPSAWSKISRSTRYKYKKILKELSDIDITDLFRERLNLDYDKLNAELGSYIAMSYYDKLYNFDF